MNEQRSENERKQTSCYESNSNESEKAWAVLNVWVQLQLALQILRD